MRNGREKLLLLLERGIYPLVLLLWPFVNVSQGVDAADGTYSLANYAYPEGLDPMWLLATWLPNRLGTIFTRLPGGGTMRGMNILCTLIIAATAEIAYFGLWKRRHRTLLFAGIWIAESLCWCPATILYNYLTYFFLTLAGVFLLRAFDADPDEARRPFYYLAGLCLGLNLFVRFPNAVEELLIPAVWFRERSDRKKLLRETGNCVLGYITGVIIPLVIIMISYGPAAYFGMIAGLFSMTGGAQDYTLSGMLLSILSAYGTTLKELLLTVPVLLTGFALFYLVTAGRNSEVREDGARELHWKRNRYLRILAVIAFAGLVLLLFRMYFSFGVFTRNYQYYDSFFEAGMMVLVLAFPVFGIGVSKLWYDDPFRRAAALLMLLMILLIPIGSNNYTYPVMNDLFLILPLLLLTLWDAVRKLREESGKPLASGVRPLLSGGIGMTLLIWSAGLITLLAVQGALFHVNFAFGDGTDGTKRDAVIDGVPRAQGMHTTRENAGSLTALYRNLHGEYADAVEAADGKAVIFGDAPGLHYLLELKPALFTAWPDLASNETARVDEALLSVAASGERPLVILREDRVAHPDTAGFSAPEKADLILDYLAETGYNELFRVIMTDGIEFIVYACDGT